MDEQGRRPVRPKEVAEDLPASSIGRVDGVCKLTASPVAGGFAVEGRIVRVEHGALVVVAEQRELAVLDDPVDALARIPAVTGDVSQAVDRFEPVGFDIAQDGFQDFEFPVNVADQGAEHGRTSSGARPGCP